MDKTLIPVNINCDIPQLVRGKKYELHLYDLHSYEGYSDEYMQLETLYITYEGGDIVQYFIQKAKELMDNRFDMDERLGEYHYKLINENDSDYGHVWDLILECFSERTSCGYRNTETIDKPQSQAAIGVNICEYREPKFINLVAAVNHEWRMKMRRIKAEQEREFYRYHNRTFTERVIDWFDGIFGHCGDIHQWKFRWRMRFVRWIGEYIRRNHPERIIFIAKLGEDRKTWSQYAYQYNIHTIFGVHEFYEFESKTKK